MEHTEYITESEPLPMQRQPVPANQQPAVDTNGLSAAESHSHSNMLLDSLPPASREALQPYLEPVVLPAGTALFDPGVPPRYVHFLSSGMASVVTSMQGGDSIEVGLVGSKGLAEGLHLLGPLVGPRRCFMQVSGEGLRMRFRRFEEEFHRDPVLHGLVLQFVQYSNLVLAQIAACNRLHEVEPRLARWLLMVEDNVGNLDFDLTQEFLAEMLGTRRPTVTIMAGGLQRKGLIAYGRKRIRILDRQGLTKVACECYPVTQKLFHDLYRT
jgi:CRP-like cAMP-binding protein